MKVKPLNTREEQWVEDTLRDNYGCDFDFSDYTILQSREKLYLVNSDLKRIEMKKLNMNSLGIYFGKKKRERVRLSQEGCFLVAPIATRNIVDLNEKQKKDFMKKLDVLDDFDCENGAFVIVKGGDYVLGPGHYRDGRLRSLIPKHRRIR